MPQSSGRAGAANAWSSIFGAARGANSADIARQRLDLAKQNAAKRDASDSRDFNYKVSHDNDTRQRELGTAAALKQERDIDNARQAEQLRLSQDTADRELWKASHPTYVAPEMPRPAEVTDPMAAFADPSRQNQENQVLAQGISARAGDIPYDTVPPSAVLPVSNRFYQYLQAGKDPNTAAQQAIDDIYGQHPAVVTAGTSADTYNHTPLVYSKIAPDPSFAPPDGTAPHPPATIDIGSGPMAKHAKEMAAWQQYEDWRSQHSAPPVYTPDWRQRDQATGYVPPPPPPVYAPQAPGGQQQPQEDSNLVMVPNPSAAPQAPQQPVQPVDPNAQAPTDPNQKKPRFVIHEFN